MPLMATVVVLIVSVSLYTGFSYRMEVFSDGVVGQHLHMTYRQTSADTPRTVSAVIHENGRSTFRIYAKSLDSAIFPDSVKVSSIKLIGGGGTIKIDDVENNALKKVQLKPKKNFDIKIFLLLSFFAYTVFYTLFERQRIFPQNVPPMQNVEFLRLVFTIGIVCVHLCPYIGLYTFGSLGVEFFFVLSGFFLTVTFKPEKNVVGYVKSKFAHFAPLTLFCLIGKMKLIPLFNSLLFLQIFTTDVMPPQSWYLGALFWSGLFYFYMMKNCPEKYNNVVFGIVTCAAYMWCIGTSWEIGVQRGLAGMGLGYFLARLYQNEKAEKTDDGSRSLYTSTEIAVLGYGVGVMFFKQLRPESEMTAVAVYAILILLFVLRRGSVSRFFDKPVFARIAACSFSVFMTHSMVIHDVLLRWRVKYPVVAEIDEKVFALAAVVICYAFGLMVWRWFETPVSAFFKNKLR